MTPYLCRRLGWTSRVKGPKEDDHTWAHSHQYATTGSGFLSSLARLRICSHAFISAGTVSEGMFTVSMVAERLVCAGADEVTRNASRAGAEPLMSMSLSVEFLIQPMEE